METPDKVGLQQLMGLLDLRQSILLMLLNVIAALTEGIGLLLLVPMLDALDGGKSGRFLSILKSIGAPVTPSGLLILFCVLVVIRALINHLRNIVSFRFQVQLIDQLRWRVWDALVHCDWRVLSGMRQTDLTSVLVTNTDLVAEALSQLMALISAVITLVGVGAAALTLSPVLVLGGLAGGIFVLYAYRGLRSRGHRLGREMNQSHRNVHAQFSEGLRGMRVVKSLGLERQVSQDANAAFAAMRNAQLTYISDLGMGQIIMQGGGAIALALGVWVAIDFAGAGFSEIVPMVALFGRGLPLLATIQDCLQSWEHDSASLGDIFALMNRAEAAREPDIGQEQPPSLDHELKFSAAGVAFAGNPRPALGGINLSLKANTTLALVGASGSGKSTLADLASGLLSADHGSVEIDGIPLEGAIRRAWRMQVAYVQQEPLLFYGSIRDNLARANPDADEERIRLALANASALFAYDLPQGIDTVIGDGARRLSGGEQQRIALARALLRDPKLLILDEATSALDGASEASVVEAIRALQGKLTILIIAHRGTLVSLADRVIELAKGRIISEPT